MGGTLYALRTDTGDVLAKWETGGTVAGGIITYRLRGRQLLAVSSGNVSRSSWGEATGAPSMVIYALPEHPMVGLLLVGERARGAHLFEDTCIACHGVGAAGGSGPALSGASAKYPGDALAEAIKKPKAPMPALFPSLLSNQDVADLVAYIRSLSKSEAP
jgi:mono/diheme cytochrome c family protein